MAINTEANNLFQEIQYAQQVRDQKLKGVDESLARRAGPDRGMKTGDSPAPENIEHEFVSFLDSMLAFDRPVVSLESPLVSKQDEVLALEIGLNRWIKASKLRQPLMQAVQDFAFAWAVFVTSVEPAPESGEGKFKDGNGATRRGLAHRPYTKRIPFRSAFRDPLATSPWDLRFAGHAEVMDKKDLIKRAKEDPEGEWDMALIEALPVDSDLSKIGRAPMQGNPSRNEVVVYHLWVADAENTKDDWGDIPEGERDLYHGKLFTLAVSLGNGNATEGRNIRKPQPFFGPRWGPYNFVGAHVVCDDAFFMSPLMPARSAINRLNKLNDVADAAAASYKRLLIVNDLVEDFAKVVKDGRHDNVFSLPGYEKGSADAFEIGGITNQMSLHESMAKEKVDRLLGMGDIQRGAVTGGASATENALASENANARMASMEHNWRDGVSQMLMTPAWYFCHDRRVKQAVSIEEFKRIGGHVDSLVQMDEESGEPATDDAGEVKIGQPYVHGGTDDHDWFDSLSMEIEVYSMRRMSEAVATSQSMFLLNYVQMIGPLVPQFPWVQWDLLNRTLAKLTGIQEMRSIINLAVAADVAHSQALADYAARQSVDDDAGAKPEGKVSGPQSAPTSVQPMQRPGQAPGGAANAAKPKPAALPGRAAGGTVGAKAAAGAGAAA